MKKTPWGDVGYITYKRTYSRRLKQDDVESPTEEFHETIERVLKGCKKQLKCGFTEEEENELRDIFLELKGSVAGRFLWQLGTKTVDTLGLPSLQNCAAVVVDNPIKPFTWAMDMLMLGCGVGYNIQKEYVYELPKPKKVKIERQDTKDADFIVPDSRAGWVELLQKTLEAHFINGKPFTYSTICIRGKGVPIKGFGGLSSGPEELCWGIQEINKILNNRSNKKIRPIDALDIMNIIGAIVVSGNVRRSAQIALGDMDDLQFLNAKRWDLGNIPNWRAMSNNSVVCNDINLLPEQFWQGYVGNGEPYGLINLKLAQEIGRAGEKEYPDELVQCVNPCVTGDTEILTDDGYKEIQYLVNQEVNVWNGFEWSNVTPTITGHNQPMVTVTFSDGRILKCTEYHKFHIADGYRGDSFVVNAVDLEPGMKLIKHNFPIIEHGPDLQDAYTQGFVAAEGMELNRTLYVYKPKEMCINRLQGVKLKSWEKNNNRYRLTLEKVPVSKNLVPVEYNLKSKLEWLSGLFDGDGTELKEGGLQLVSVNRNFLNNLQKLLSTLGVQSKVLYGNKAGMRLMPDHKGGSKEFMCQESYRICIGAVQMQTLKKIGLSCERMSFDKTPQRDASQFVTIVDVTSSGIEDTVYCFNEPKRHLGVFNGVLTGQCSEQTLANYETCCLSEIFLPNINSKEELLKVAKYLYRINKHSLALDCHHIETQEIVNKNMRMGIGITGYLQCSEEKKNWLKDIYKELRQFDVEYSKQHGFPNSIKLTTIKPSGTLSLLAGVTPGAHPGYSEYYIRRIRMASNIPLVATCRENGYDIEYQKNFDGTDDKNTVVVSFPCSFPKDTIFAKDMNAIEQLETIKRLQKEWSDNAVSVTIYYTKEELTDIKKWLVNNYNTNLKCVSFLLKQEHGFIQPPLEEINQEQYENMKSKIKNIDLIQYIDENSIKTTEECESGVCPVR